jgi:ATP-dependent DNA helicase DinG
MNDESSSDRILYPVAIQSGTGLARITVQGVVETLSAAEGLQCLAAEPHLVCHAPYLIERLCLIAGTGRSAARSATDVRHLDVAELYVFVSPARFAIPTPAGLARVLRIEARDGAKAVLAVAMELLRRLTLEGFPDRRETAEIANFLAQANWPWAKPVLRALSQGNGRLDAATFVTGLNVWDRIPEWEDGGPATPGSHHPVEQEAALAKLDELLGDDAEERPGQRAYCAAAVHAFAPRQKAHENNILLAEAGTGLGKTLAYLAPAHLWSKRNRHPVWLSTYTKNLQRQLEQETARIFPDPDERRERVVVRKGRENYLCLLNMQEIFGRLTTRNARSALTAALIARWARYSRDGDMAGGDFPAWLMSLLADGRTDYRPMTPQSLGLTDRRGECIYSACPHYRRCFIERAQRSARNADMVIANHALVLHRAAVDYALGIAPDKEIDGGDVRRLVLDEGHHLFDAADSAFSGHLTALETAELRRWIRGPESRGRRGRSLADRLADLVADDEDSEKLIEQIAGAARTLPGPGWQQRIQAGAPEGPTEIFLALVRQQVLARADSGGGQTLETDCDPLIDGLERESGLLSAELLELQRPMLMLAGELLKKLDARADELDSAERARIEAVARSLKRRAGVMIAGFIDMLDHLISSPPPAFVGWFAIEQQGGREIDVGLHRHWIDPTQPLAEIVLKRTDGIIITSATLKDRPPEAPDDWQSAEMRTGVAHLPYAVRRISHDSPYDYRRNARIIVVNDVNREDMDQVAAAYRELFIASSGGALGLFTAISRLRQVHGRLIEPMAQRGLSLFAQHVDPIDTGTLVDMFRAESDACLLGTDAVRDGVDVPGDSLRLIVLDRVPWGQPSILDRARRQAFGGTAYQDMIVRLRLRQAFGRLIRGAGDRGVFVVLDARLASRFLTAFPENTPVARCGLVEAIEQVQSFLGLASRNARS